MHPSDFWPNGARATKVVAGRVIGGTIVKWTRERDGKTFVMVRPDWTEKPGFQQPAKEWPDSGRWVLGEGPFKRDCLGCEQPFYAKEQTADFCVRCDDAPARVAAASRGSRNIGAALRGARGYGLGMRPVAPMTEAEAAAVAAQKAKDQEESPY